MPVFKAFREAAVQHASDYVSENSLGSRLWSDYDPIKEQMDWIVLCGGGLQGYVDNYGSAHDPERTSQGEGGEVIFTADLAELKKRIDRYFA